MKRKLIISLLATASAIACAFGLAACGEKPHEHDYSSRVVAPTCTEGGYTVHTCACGDSYTDEQTQPTGHAWGEWQTITAADCTNGGSQKRVCAHDSTHVETQNTNPIGHSYGSPVWTWNGYESATAKLTCATDKTHVETVSAVITNEITTPATCTTSGVKTYTATVTVNGDTYTDTKTEAVAATGHSYSDEWTSDAQYHWHAATCGHSDEINGKAEHTWDDGYCSICGKKDPSMPSEGLTYTLSNDETYYSVEGIGTCTDTELVIPSTYNDKPVTGIRSYAFESCSSLTSIIIPNSVTSIGDSAFRSCSSLTSITIPDSVTSIGEYVFYNCYGLTSVTIGNSVTSIGVDAFRSCISLTSITIPNSVTSIGNGTFLYCEGLTSITIPNSVTIIGGFAFSDCSGLTSITIPDSVTSIGWNAFYNTAYYNDNNNWENDVLYIGKHLIKSKASITGEYAIKDGTLTIAYDAFSDCSSLTSITIPNSVTSIDNFAFEDCSSLTSVTIPDGVTSIGKYAFNNCSNLTSVTIGNSVTSIGYSAFYNCSSLTSVTIPDSVKSIDYMAFYNCYRLIEVKNLSSLTITAGSSSNGYIGCYAKRVYTEGESYLSTNENGYIIYNDGTDKILVGYTGTETELNLPNGITQINQYAFDGCSNLTSITIPDSVTSISEAAFKDCNNLTSIIFNGTMAQWQAIEKGSNWNSNTGNYTVTCTDGTLDKDGNVVS